MSKWDLFFQQKLSTCFTKQNQYKEIMALTCTYYMMELSLVWQITRTISEKIWRNICIISGVILNLAKSLKLCNNTFYVSNIVPCDDQHKKKVEEVDTILENLCKDDFDKFDSTVSITLLFIISLLSTRKFSLPKIRIF